MITLTKKLTINEIFFSIQGESYLSGWPCIFIRLTGCHQRCTYCDTEYAFYEGQKMTLENILAKIKKYPCQNVLITGGEPLLQENTVVLMQELLNRQYKVAVETGGARDISHLPEAVIKIMDLKTPGSGEMHRNRLQNIQHLKPSDEVKFVVTDATDVQWAIEQIKQLKLDQRCHVSLSPIKNELHQTIAKSILNSGLKVRQQMQFHKMIWPQEERGI